MKNRRMRITEFFQSAPEHSFFAVQEIGQRYEAFFKYDSKVTDVKNSLNREFNLKKAIEYAKHQEQEQKEEPKLPQVVYETPE